MSVHVMAMVYKARLGCPLRKAVALKLADCCDDEGDNIWPAVETIAAQAEISSRTVQRKLRELEQAGLIAIVSAGGGRRKTNTYKFDMRALFGIASGLAKFVVEGDVAGIIAVPEDAENGKGDRETPFFAAQKGDTQSPFQNGKGDTDDIKGDTQSQKGDTQSPNPSYPLEPPTQKRASAGVCGDMQPTSKFSGILEHLAERWPTVVSEFLEPVTALVVVQHTQPAVLFQAIAERLANEDPETLRRAAEVLAEQRHKLVSLRNALDAIATARQLDREAKADGATVMISRDEHNRQWAAWKRWASLTVESGKATRSELIVARVILEARERIPVASEWPPSRTTKPETEDTTP